MKWILVVLAITADSEAILAPRDAPRTTMASALRAMYIERELLKDVHDGIVFDSNSLVFVSARLEKARWEADMLLAIQDDATDADRLADEAEWQATFL